MIVIASLAYASFHQTELINIFNTHEKLTNILTYITERTQRTQSNAKRTQHNGCKTDATSNISVSW